MLLSGSIFYWAWILRTPATEVDALLLRVLAYF